MGKCKKCVRYKLVIYSVVCLLLFLSIVVYYVWGKNL